MSYIISIEYLIIYTVQCHSETYSKFHLADEGIVRTINFILIIQRM